MLKLSRLKVAGVFALTVALGGTMVACGGNDAADGGIQDTSEGVAATLVYKDKEDKEVTLEIGEKIVTQYIEDFRTRNELTDANAWGQWLADNSLTPADVRTQVINYYEEELLLDEAANMYGVTVDEAEVQEALQDIKNQFESEEAYQEALAATGLTEEEYIEKVLEPNTKQQKLAEAVEAEQGEAVDTDAQTLAMAQSMESMLDGSRRSSHILFSVDDTENAQAVLDQINNGSLSWEDAVAEYSIDEGTKETGGDNGWDTINSFVTEYTDALSGLAEGQVSELVTSEYGIHIIKCTEVFEVPEDGITSLDQLPTEIADALRQQVESTSSDTFSTWFQNFIDNSQLTINDMPEGLPYDVDMSAYASTVDETTEGLEGAEEAVEGEATAEGAEADQAAADAAAAEAAAAEAAAAEADQAAVESTGADATGESAETGEPVDEGATDTTGEPTEGTEGAEGNSAQ